MKKYQGKAQPKIIYKRNISCGLILLIASLAILIPNYITGKIYDFDTFAVICSFACGVLGLIVLLWCLYCYETFYITDDYIVIKNCFKKLKMIKKSDIKHIYVESVIIGGNFGRSFFWQYIVISESPKSNYKEDIYRPYLNAKYRKEITIDFSCKNEDIINEWTENKFDLYN